MIHHYHPLALYPESRFPSWFGREAYDYFKFVDDPAKADLLVHPADRNFESQENRAWTFKILELSGYLNKQAIVFNNDDLGVPIAGFFNIMHAAHRSWPIDSLIASPCINSMMKTLKDLPLPVRKKARPQVNFCGTTTTCSLRSEVIKVLRACGGIDSEVIIRPQYFYTLFGKEEPQTEAALRADFIRTMQECDYNLHVRGFANTAFRLYETLCAGRIPIVIDTGTLFPRPELPEWGLCCTVTNLSKFEETILTHYETVGLNHFEQCRQFWNDYLSPRAWFLWLRVRLEQLCRRTTTVLLR